MNLVELIRLYTGCDATTEPAFALADDVPCTRCGTVTLTAVLIDGEDAVAVRMCVECCRAW